MSCTSTFSSYVKIISSLFIVIIKGLFTNPASVTRLKLFLFFTRDQIFAKVFFHYFFTILILFKNCLNKFINSIVTSKNNNWLTKFIINANNFISKAIRNVILIFFKQEPSQFSTLFRLQSKSASILNGAGIYLK